MWDRLTDHLSERICIIRVKTHDRTIRILVKITDWKSLHMFKHIIPYFFKNTLTNVDHQSCISKCSNDSHQENASKHRKCPI